MNKEQSKKATLKDFIAKKIKKEQDQFKIIDVYVSSMERTITLKKPTDEQLLDYMEELGDGEDKRQAANANRHLIYRCCAELQNPELHKECEIKDPYDIVEALYDLTDINEIMEQFADLMGYKKTGEDIKN